MGDFLAVGEASADLVLDTLRSLAEHGFAVLVASHDERLIALGTRIAWLRETFG